MQHLLRKCFFDFSLNVEIEVDVSLFMSVLVKIPGHTNIVDTLTLSRFSEVSQVLYFFALRIRLVG